MQSHRISSIQSKPRCETGGSLGYCHCMPAPGATSLAQRVSSAHHGAHSGQGTRTYFKVSPWFYPHLFPAFQLVQKKKINLFIKFEFQVLFCFLCLFRFRNIYPSLSDRIHKFTVLKIMRVNLLKRKTNEFDKDLLRWRRLVFQNV